MLHEDEPDANRRCGKRVLVRLVPHTVSVRLPPDSSQMLLPFFQGWHVWFDTVPSSVDHYFMPVFSAVLISQEVGRTHILIIVVGIQALLRALTFLQAGVDISGFSRPVVHFSLIVLRLGACAVSRV